jgi:membrane fusion protein, multidrug efflux system
MAKRMILMLVAMTVFVFAIGLVKFQQIRAAIAEASAYQPPPEAVTTVVAREEPWEATFQAVGTVTAVQGVVVSADLAGIVERIAFESGSFVREGEVLVQLDTRQEQAQLRAAQSDLDLARLNLERMRGLREKGVTSQAELDAAEAQFKSAEARAGEIRATIDRKTIRAPFSGILGIRQVNLGQYLNGGDPVVPLQSLHPIHVDFAVPQQQAGQVRRGTEVDVVAEGAGITALGYVTAIDSVVDEATRNLRVQATLSNTDGRLRPGMFVESRVRLGASPAVVAVPLSSIRYAPYGDSVFVVEEVQTPDGSTYRGVRQQFVKLGASRGDQIAILSGVSPGEELVTSGVFKLRNGAPVHVDNTVQPSNDPAPRPEES